MLLYVEAVPEAHVEYVNCALLKCVINNAAIQGPIGSIDEYSFEDYILPVEKIEDLKENFPEYFGETITETIKVQIKESQDEVVEALYPIMGKLVKKFIIAEIAKLSESINDTINNKFSVKQIIKRLFKGNTTDAEDVLQQVFEPIIEEVFIIEKDSGLLVGNYSRGNIADKDMVSGMLTAIKSFVLLCFMFIFLIFMGCENTLIYLIRK